MKNRISAIFKIASLILTAASISTIAMDPYWDREEIDLLARTYRNLEQQKAPAGELYFLCGLQERLGQNSPVSCTYPHIMQEIFTFLVPAPEEYIYLDTYERCHYYKKEETSTRPISVKVLRKGIQTFAHLKKHIRQSLHLAPDNWIEIRYGHLNSPADTAQIATIVSNCLKYGSPERPLHLILSSLPQYL